MTLNVDNLYEKYKENASLDRTLVKLKFKDKKVSKGQQLAYDNIKED